MRWIYCIASNQETTTLQIEKTLLCSFLFLLNLHKYWSTLINERWYYNWTLIHAMYRFYNYIVVLLYKCLGTHTTRIRLKQFQNRFGFEIEQEKRCRLPSKLGSSNWTFRGMHFHSLVWKNFSLQLLAWLSLARSCAED